ncbi:DUF3800 domain-containing protein [Azospirillum sp. sgz302134]
MSSNLNNLYSPSLICCDEAGFTGNDLTNPDQPYFSYASVNLEIDEAEILLAELRARHKIQMPELKARKLIKKPNGRAFIDDVLKRIDGRYICTLYNKKLCLAGKVFEYIYEPVIQENNMLFYKNNLHRFVAMYLYIQMIDKPIEDLAKEFESFMRSLDPHEAPTLFGVHEDKAHDQLIGQMLRFARGYNLTIVQEARSLSQSKDTGKWILDLTTSAINSHLAYWGERHPVIQVTCDESKPLLALADIFNVMVNRSERVYMDALGKRRAITWNMSRPIEFASSASHACIQIADLVAGTTAAIPGANSDNGLMPLAEKIFEHMNEDCILPDPDVIDFSGDEALVNWIVLEELACRADNGRNPIDGMEEFYNTVKRSLPKFREKLLVDIV